MMEVLREDGHFSWSGSGGIRSVDLAEDRSGTFCCTSGINLQRSSLLIHAQSLTVKHDP